jgi:rod shape-determining protein MreC
MLQFLVKRKSIIILSVLLLISLTLFARNVERREGGSFIDSVILWGVAPVLQITTLCIQKVSQFWFDYLYLVNLGRENTSLKTTIKIIQLENQDLREEALENIRLRDLLGLKKRLPYPSVPAQIIGRDPSSWFKTVLIDKGAADGVHRGQAVVTSLGFVGQTLEVTEHTSKVLLIIDGYSAVDILVQRTRAKGIVEGRTDEEQCDLRYVAKTDEVKVGDVVVTSGINEALPKGIVVGEVLSVNKAHAGFFQLIELKPVVDFSKLEEVLVILK